MDIRSAGSVEVVALRDASGSFFEPRSIALPGASDEAWREAERLDPGAFGDDDSWLLDFTCFAIRRPGDRVTLVDTGVGPAGSPAAPWAPVPGRLPERLATAGIDPGTVDLVVLTHLHEDHFGWSVDAAGKPMFPNARYVVQRTELLTLPAGDAAWTYVVEPLRSTGQLDEIDGRTRLGSRITAVPTPGHTPGHQSVLVEDGSEQIVITGDLLVHAVQLADPDVPYSHERDREMALRSRRELLARARDRGAVLATAHLTRPFVSP